MIALIFGGLILAIGVLSGALILIAAWLVVGVVIWLPLGLLIGSVQVAFVLWCILGLGIVWLSAKSE